MTAAPLEPSHPMQRRLLTVAEYAALGETEIGQTELIEGRLLLSPSPVADHNHALLRLAVGISAALPAVQRTARRPDLMVIRAHAQRRIREQAGCCAHPMRCSPWRSCRRGSVRVDRVTERLEYADAGIPYYWIVDFSEPVSIVACQLADELGHADSGELTGTFRTGEPFGFELDLATWPDRDPAPVGIHLSR